MTANFVIVIIWEYIFNNFNQFTPHNVCFTIRKSDLVSLVIKIVTELIQETNSLWVLLSISLVVAEELFFFDLVVSFEIVIHACLAAALLS